MRLYLVRHPRPAVAEGICYGQTDLPLADDPIACAAQLRTLLPADVPLFSSPLARCRQLAVHLHAAPTFDARLMELDFGAWEMQAWATIERTALDAWAAAPLQFLPPDGESVAMLRTRVVACLAELPERAIVVAHAGVMKLCVAALAGMAERDWLGLHFDYASVSLIEAGRLAWHNRRSNAAA